jgi:hypothetical protein
MLLEMEILIKKVGVMLLVAIIIEKVRMKCKRTLNVKVNIQCKTTLKRKVDVKLF